MGVHQHAVQDQPPRRDSSGGLAAKLAAGFILVGIGSVVYAAVHGGFRSPYGPGYDVLGEWLIGALGLSCLALWFFTWRRRALMIAGLLIAYVGSYSVLSATGGYYLTRSGKTPWGATGMAVLDESIWFPSGLYWEPFLTISGEKTTRGTVLGHFYSPLIRLDRALVHPSQRLPWLDEPR